MMHIWHNSGSYNLKEKFLEACSENIFTLKKEILEGICPFLSPSRMWNCLPTYLLQHFVCRWVDEPQDEEGHTEGDRTNGWWEFCPWLTLLSYQSYWLWNFPLSGCLVVWAETFSFLFNLAESGCLLIAAQSVTTVTRGQRKDLLGHSVFSVILGQLLPLSGAFVL